MRPEFLKLSELMTGGRKPGRIVAFELGKAVEWKTFSGQVAGLCLELESRRRGEWLVASQSSYSFAVSLCALWQTGNVAVLPPNLQRGSLEEMSGGLCGILSDSSFSFSGLPVLSPAAYKGKPRKWLPLDAGKISLRLCTSGSTGARKGVSKTLANIEEELSVLEETFGGRLGDCAVLSTVSHQHIYGLLFRLLWPLCAGRPFISETPLLWGELWGPCAVCLVSSPAHLDHACAAGRDIKLPAGCRIIFSSGAPLAKNTSYSVLERWGLPVIEVFGSTETGGVGWRVQSDPQSSGLWTPFKSVTVSSFSDATSDSRLRVSSAFASSSAVKGWCALGDIGKVYPDGRFLTDGRIDRIVKIAGKRLSLDEMERHLNRQPSVSRAVLTILKTQGNSARPAIGAVIALNRKGKEQLQNSGRLAVSKKIRTELKKHFDAVTLPRYFRYVESMPLNSQGKIVQADLENLFPAPVSRRFTE
jgi:acyl-coenzyme A synthetase/AMP-(fatty) acid ligase